MRAINSLPALIVIAILLFPVAVQVEYTSFELFL